jgi:hypothetical protein
MAIKHLTWTTDPGSGGRLLFGDGVSAAVVVWSSSSAKPALPGATTVVIRGDEGEGGMAWLPGPRRAFEAFVGGIEGGGRALVVWPGAGLPISDVPSLLSFLRARERWGFVLDLDGCIPEGMPGAIADHVDRVLGGLAEHPCLWGVCMPRRVALSAAQRELLDAAAQRCGRVVE